MVEISPETFASIGTHGLPTELSTILAELGLSALEIDETAAAIAQLDPTVFQASTDVRDMAIISSINLAVSSIDELQAAIRLRVNDLSGEVQPVSPAQLTTFSTEREKLQKQLTGLTPTASLRQEIERHITGIRELILQTNDMESLHDELDQGYRLLIAYQSQSFKLSEVIELIDEGEADSQINASFAEHLRTELSSLRQSLFDSDYDGVVLGLDGLIVDVTERRGDSVSPEFVEQLNGWLAFLHDFYSFGELGTTPTAWMTLQPWFLGKRFRLMCFRTTNMEVRERYGSLTCRGPPTERPHWTTAEHHLITATIVLCIKPTPSAVATVLRIFSGPATRINSRLSRS